MKQVFSFAVLLIVVVQSAAALEVIAPTVAEADKEGNVWYDAREIGLEGKGWQETKSIFDRLPAKAENIVRPPVWSLSHDSAGLSVRFLSDSTAIHVRWSLTSANLAMPHMPASGVSGVDLYVRDSSGWRWLANGRPTAQSNTVKLVGDLQPSQREYILYLPLYNGVTSLEIGLPRDKQMWKVRPWDEHKKRPLVFWGTSITQGGCALRPGMVHTSILGRRFQRPVINLGFSGNGRMEPEMARLIAEIDAAVYVVDCLPNLNADQVAERAEPVVRILRETRERTPILLVEDRTYADAFMVPSRERRNRTSRVELRNAYRRLRDAGVPELYYLSGDQLLGEDGEDTVDGSHPTDLGFMRQAEAFAAVLEPIVSALGERPVPSN